MSVRSSNDLKVAKIRRHDTLSGVLCHDIHSRGVCKQAHVNVHASVRGMTWVVVVPDVFSYICLHMIVQ